MKHDYKGMILNVSSIPTSIFWEEQNVQDPVLEDMLAIYNFNLAARECVHDYAERMKILDEIGLIVDNYEFERILISCNVPWFIHDQETYFEGQRGYKISYHILQTIIDK